MQLSVRTQAAHLWICFSTVLTSVSWCSPQTKQRNDGEAVSSLRGVPLVAVDVFFLCQVQCARGWRSRSEQELLLFGSGEQLKWSRRTMGGHYSLIDTLWKLMKRAGGCWILEHWVHIKYWMVSGIDAIRRNWKTWQLARKLFRLHGRLSSTVQRQ